MSWKMKSEKEKLDVVDIVLNNLRNLMMDKNTLDVSISTDGGNDIPEVRNGLGKVINLPYVSTDTITIEIASMKNSN